jgi:hypothetical protein
MNKVNYFKDIVEEVKLNDFKYLENEEGICHVCGKKCYSIDNWFNLINEESNGDKDIYSKLLIDNKWNNLIGVKLKNFLICKGCYKNFSEIDLMFRDMENKNVKNRKI